MRFDLSDIHAAKKELEKILEPTPLVRNPWLSELFDCEVFLKLENMQPIGSFKIRGATYRISRLSRAERRKGVIAASAGNHAQGVAWGSRRLGVKATIVMPVNAPLVKIQNTRALGAEIIMFGTNFDDAKAHAEKLAKKSGKVLIPAFENEDVIAGQGTIGLEILEQLPEVDWIVGSIGGGGMMAGVGVAVKSLRPKTKIAACQATGAPAMLESLKKGRAVKSEKVQTFADGIAVRQARESMRKVLACVVDAPVAVDDERTADAVLLLLEKAKTVVEGSGAIALAALDQLRAKIKGKKVVVIVSGGNIDVNLLGRIIDHGMLHSGRRMRVNVWLSDRPGSLAHLTERLAFWGANVLQAIHDHNLPSSKVEETEVSLTLETRGPEHSAAILKGLKAEFRRVELT